MTGYEEGRQECHADDDLSLESVHIPDCLFHRGWLNLETENLGRVEIWMMAEVTAWMGGWWIFSALNSFLVLALQLYPSIQIIESPSRFHS